MKTNKEMLKEYIVTKYDEKFHMYRTISDDEALATLENGFMVPFVSHHYLPKNIIIGVIINNTIQYYKAVRR